MKTSLFQWTRAAALLSAAAVLAACGGASREPASPSAEPAAPAAANPQPAAGQATASPQRARHTEADVRFMQAMIGHHAQALEMTRLVEERTTRRDIRLLAERIEISQHDEIARMRRWLEERGQAAPAADAHHGHGGDHAGMPGMLTAQELARLAAARGAEFDRLFLEYMIRHHEGALVMVSELFAAGGGQESEIFQLANDVDADQRAEIARMRRVQTGAPSGAP